MTCAIGASRRRRPVQADWRADYDALTYEWINTPREVADGVRAYMVTLGLSYAALDFGIDADQRFW